MTQQSIYTALGLTADSNRSINSGNQYNKYFSPEKGKVILLRANGTTYDTIQLMKEWIEKYGSQCAKIAPILKGNTLYNTCQNIEKWQMEHFRYHMFY